MLKMIGKSWKNMIFMVCRYFTCGKLGKNHGKKHVNNGKSGNLQKVLKLSIRLQIMFLIAEKIAIDCFDPNPKYEKNS